MATDHPGSEEITAYVSGLLRGMKHNAEILSERNPLPDMDEHVLQERIDAVNDVLNFCTGGMDNGRHS